MIALLLAAVASCAGDGSEGKPSATSDSADSARASDTWLLCGAIKGAGSGVDQEPGHLVFVSYQPETGDVETSKMPSAVVDHGCRGELLRISSDYRWVTQSSGKVTEEEAAAGVINLYGLEDGERRTVDLRAMVGRGSLEPRLVAFDPRDPTVLHVVDDRGTYWRVDFEEGEATKDPDEFLPGSTWLANGADIYRDRKGRLAEKHLGDQWVSQGDTEDYVQAEDGLVWAFGVEGESEAGRLLRGYSVDPDSDDPEWEPHEGASLGIHPDLEAAFPPRN